MNMERIESNAPRRSAKLAGILADLKAKKCEHFDYANILNRLNKTIKLYPDYVLTHGENTKLLNLHSLMLIEEKKDHLTRNAPCVKCGFGPEHKGDFKKAISEILKVLDEALKLPTITYTDYLRTFFST